MKINVAIVIPVYYSEFSYLEKISFNQNMDILKKYDKYFVIPESLNVGNDIKQKNVRVIKVNDKYMKDLDSYSQMLCSSYFYNMFIKYDYILIAQLDSFIFKDEVIEFCKLGYDYIGAPWPGRVRVYTDNNVKLLSVGNGGLSLRKVRSHIDLLERGVKRKEGMPEDVFWASQNSKSYKVAPEEVARKFSLEAKAEQYYRKNGNILPMGCHAWWKVSCDFWYKIIRNMNISLKECSYKEGVLTDYRYLLLDSDILKSVIDKYIADDIKIYIWGAGTYGEDCGWIFNNIGKTQYIYVDKYKKGNLWGKKIENTQLLYAENSIKQVVVIANKNYCNEIVEELKVNKFKGKIICFSDIVRDLNIELNKLLADDEM